MGTLFCDVLTQLCSFFISRKETLDAQFLKRYIVRRAKGGVGGKELEFPFIHLK